MDKKKNGKIEINAILQPAGTEEQSWQERKVRRKFWSKMKLAVTRLPFVEDVVTMYFCALDKNTPNYVRGILLAALTYFIVPVDIVPDFITVIGFGDDVSVLAAALTMVQKYMTEAQRSAAKKALRDFTLEK